MKKESVPSIEERPLAELLPEKLEEMRKQYTRGGAIGKGTRERMQYTVSLAEIGGLATGILAALESEGPNKKLLQELKTTLQTLMSVAPADMKDSGLLEKTVEKLGKYIED